MELAELVCEVTADRVAAIAASTVCDQIYLLRAPEASAEGTGEEEEGGGEA
jgi:hypothetical protein